MVWGKFFGKTNPHSKIFAQNESWLRLVTLLVHAGTAALRDVFHGVGGKSSDPAKLYHELIPYKRVLVKILRKDQYDLVYPSNGKTYSERFDITLLVLLIQQCTSVSPPIGPKGWKTDVDKIKKHDTSKGAYILKLRKLRNYIIHHYITTDLPHAEFLDLWAELIFLLQCLGYTIDKSIERLKYDSFNNMDQFKLSLLQAKTIYFEESISTLTEDIKNNEKKGLDLHLQQAVLRADMKTIEDTVRDITNKTLQVDSTQMNHSHEIEVLKLNIQGILQRTQHIQETLAQSSNDYGINFQQINHTLKLEHQTLDDLSQKVAQLEMYVEHPDFEKRLDKASNYLKETVSSKHNRECLQNPFSIHNSEKAFFVDLVILDIDDRSKDFHNTDREHHINMQLRRSKSITIEKLFNLDNHGYMILRGCAGVGKSFLTNHLCYLWATCQIWKDFKFVFHFTCRELNRISQVGTFEKLLVQFYPHIFNTITFKELQGISSQICVVIDGLDEFVSIEEMERIFNGECSATFPITECLFNIVSLKYSILTKSLVVVSGRPAACSILLQGLGNLNKRIVDVLGFNENNVERYVETFFDRDKDTVSLVKREIRANPAMNLMVRIPVYLHILCSLYKSQEQFEIPKTITELYVLELILFMKKHFSKHKQVNLTGLIEDGNFCKAVIDLAAISYHTLEKGKIVVGSRDEVALMPAFEVLKASGMISEIDTITGKVFQYFHLTMQEFLAAIHIILSGINLNDIYHRPLKRTPCNINMNRLRGTLPLVFGLQGAEMMTTDENVYFPRELMLNIRKWCEDSRCVPLEINHLFKYAQAKSFDVSLETNSEYALFLHCYYEYQTRLERDVWLKNLTNNSGGIDLIFHIQIPLHVKHISFFLANELRHMKSLELKLSDALDLVNTNTHDLFTLLKYVLQCKHFKCDDLSLRHFPLSESSHAESVINGDGCGTVNKIKILQIEVKQQECNFDKVWLKLPESLILTSWLPFDVLIESLNNWLHGYTNLDNLKSVTLIILDSTNNKLGHVMAFLDIFHFVPKLHVNLSADSELHGFTTCNGFIEQLRLFLRPRNLSLRSLTLQMRTEKHIYQTEGGYPDCERCINGTNIRNTPFYKDDDLLDFEIISNRGSTNSRESIDMGIIGDTVALVYQNEIGKYWTLKKCLLLWALVIILIIAGSILLWWFQFHS